MECVGVWKGDTMIEKYCVYEPSTNIIHSLFDTPSESLSEVKFANVFRRMLNQEPLMAGKVSLTEEEYLTLLNKNGV